MRVITGSARGRRLKELPGLETRPTAAKVKEGVFSAIQFELEGARVLDLFGGTGQLGIEALSRGAAEADFVDQSREAAAVIRENLAFTGLAARGRVHQGDALGYLSSCRTKYGVIFLDPPYHTELLEKALEKIAGIDISAENGIIICESAAEKVLPELPAPYVREREYRYGKIKVTKYRRIVE